LIFNKTKKRSQQCRFLVKKAKKIKIEQQTNSPCKHLPLHDSVVVWRKAKSTAWPAKWLFRIDIVLVDSLRCCRLRKEWVIRTSIKQPV